MVALDALAVFAVVFCAVLLATFSAGLPAPAFLTLVAIVASPVKKIQKTQNAGCISAGPRFILACCGQSSQQLRTSSLKGQLISPLSPLYSPWAKGAMGRDFVFPFQSLAKIVRDIDSLRRMVQTKRRETGSRRLVAVRKEQLISFLSKQLLFWLPRRVPALRWRFPPLRCRGPRICCRISPDGLFP